jgi:hypothetical protein
MSDRFFDSFARLMREAFPWIGYAGTYEYEVFAANPPLYDLRPTRSVAGLPAFGGALPDLPPTAVKPGVPGVTSTLAVGALVLVTFVNCDAAKPVIIAVSGPGESVFKPTALAIGADGTISIGDSTHQLLLGLGDAIVMRHGDLAQFDGTGAIVAGPTGTLTTVLGTIKLAPPALAAAGPAGTGHSQVRA